MNKLKRRQGKKVRSSLQLSSGGALSDTDSQRLTTHANPTECVPSADKPYTSLTIILIASLITRFYGLTYPAQVVFDEVHFGGFVNRYRLREYFFDIHPPLGKLIFALWAEILGLDANFVWDPIGKDFPDVRYALLRIPAAFASSLLPILGFMTAWELKLSKYCCYVVASALMFDTAILVSTRYVLVDAFLYFFIALAFYSWVRFYRTASFAEKHCGSCMSARQPRFWCLITGLSMGLAASVKWTGLGVVGAVGLGHLSWFVYGLVRYSGYARHRFSSGVVMLAVAAFVYYVFWILHFKMCSKSGPGNIWHQYGPEGFAFLSTLTGSGVPLPYGFKTPSMWQNIRKIHEIMLSANAGLPSQHGWSSMWYFWPFSVQGVLYWVRYGSGWRQMIYLVGNPSVWWSSAILTFCFMNVLLYELVRWNCKSTLFRWGLLLLFAYLINWVPYAKISRVCFLYHYIPSLYYSVLISAVLLDHLLSPLLAKWVSWILSLSHLAMFVYFSPFVYATTISHSEYEAMVWLPTWV